MPIPNTVALTIALISGFLSKTVLPLNDSPFVTLVPIVPSRLGLSTNVISSHFPPLYSNISDFTTLYSFMLPELLPRFCHLEAYFGGILYIFHTIF